MMVNTVVDKKAAVMIHTVTGEMTFDEIKSSYEAILSHPEFQEDMNSIWDMQDMEIDERLEFLDKIDEDEKVTKWQKHLECFMNALAR